MTISTLVTVCTPDFVAGTLVMLTSFRQQHPAFTGELVILHDAALTPHQPLLTHYLPGVRFEPVSAALTERLDALTAAVPRLERIRARFYALDAFRWDGPDRVLFADSDLLFCAPIDTFLNAPEPLAACPDDVMYTGKGRRLRTLAAADPAEPDVLYPMFNSGLMNIGPELRTPDHWAALLDDIRADAYDDHAMMADQYLLNRHFRGQFTLYGPEYNYLMFNHADLYAHSGLRWHEAKVLHFAQTPKPWRFDLLMSAAARGEVLWLRAVQRWHAAFFSLIDAEAVRAAFDVVPASES